MSQAKTNPTAILLSGSPELFDNKAAVVMVPGSLAKLSSGGELTTPLSGANWSGEILVSLDELGQGYSGVFATDSAVGNRAEAAGLTRHAVVDTNEDFYAYAYAGKGDISIGDSLVMVTANNCGMVQELSSYISDNGAGVYYTVAIALEDVAVSGLLVNTPVKCRRIFGAPTYIDASQVIYSPDPDLPTGTDVQAALDEVASYTRMMVGLEDFDALTYDLDASVTPLNWDFTQFYQLPNMDFGA